MCRSRRELSNEYLLAEFDFDTAEDEPDLNFLIFLPFGDLNFPYVSHPRRRYVAGFAFRFGHPLAEAIVRAAGLKNCKQSRAVHCFRRSSDDISQVPPPYSKGIFERRRGGKTLCGQVEEHVSVAGCRKMTLSGHSDSTNLSGPSHVSCSLLRLRIALCFLVTQ